MYEKVEHGDLIDIVMGMIALGHVCANLIYSVSALSLSVGDCSLQIIQNY